MGTCAHQNWEKPVPMSLPGSAAAAKAVSRYLGKHRAEGQRIPLPAVPGAPDAERYGDGGRAEDEESPLSDEANERPGSIVLLGDDERPLVGLEGLEQRRDLARQRRVAGAVIGGLAQAQRIGFTCGLPPTAAAPWPRSSPGWA